MAGDPTKVRVWDRIEVYKGTVDEPSRPDTIDEPLGPEWELIGLLDPAGLDETIDSSSTDVLDYQGNVIRAVQESFALSYAFTALEQNEHVRSIAWPGSTDTKIVTPLYRPFPLCLELHDGNYVERRFTEAGAQVTGVAPQTKTRTAPDSVQITVKVLAKGDGTLFTRQAGEVA